jgi:hypothetical protein
MTWTAALRFGRIGGLFVQKMPYGEPMVTRKSLPTWSVRPLAIGLAALLGCCGTASAKWSLWPFGQGSGLRKIASKPQRMLSSIGSGTKKAVQSTKNLFSKKEEEDASFRSPNAAWQQQTRPSWNRSEAPKKKSGLASWFGRKEEPGPSKTVTGFMNSDRLDP